MKRTVAFLLAAVMIAAASASAVSAISGDANGDGTADNKDVVVLFRYVSGNAAGAVEENCDYNGDKTVDNKDVVALFRAVSGGAGLQANTLNALLKAGKTVECKAERVYYSAAVTVNGTYFKQLQGGCTDGEYMYFALNDTKSEGSQSLIYKIKPGESKPEKISEPLQIDHANDITYNKDKNRLIVVHNAPNKKVLSFIDKDTLTVTDRTEISFKTFCAQYCPERGMYVFGKAGGQNFNLLDKDFNVVKKIEVETTGYTTQGVDCDGDFIYFVQYNKNVIVVYDWDGNRVCVIDLPITGCEPENIFHIGDEFYTGCSSSGILVYKLTFKEKS